MTSEEIERFAKLLRLLASPHDGERAAAARKATEFLVVRKLDWHYVAELLKPDPVQGQKGTIEHYEAAWQCLQSGQHWSDRESDFLEDMMGISFPSPKQLEWLGRLYARYLQRKS